MLDINRQPTIIFLAEMPLTNGVIQAQLLPVAISAAQSGYSVHIIETAGRFESQEENRKAVTEELRRNGILSQKITVKQRTIFPSIISFTIKSYQRTADLIKEHAGKQVILYARNYKFCPIVLYAKWRWNIPFIYSPRGAYVAERNFYRRFKDLLYGRYIGLLERRAIHKSEATIVETAPFKRHLERAYHIKTKKLVVIPNFFNTALLPPPEWNRDAMRIELGFTDKHVIAYAGTVEVWYEFERMFDLVSRLKQKDPTVFFQLFLKEDYARKESRGLLKKLSRLAEKYGMREGGDYAISSYPPSQRYLYLSACDAGICLTAPEEFKAIMLYLKIVDYLGARLPVIINKDVLAVRKIIKESGAGVTVDYKNWERSIDRIDTDKLFRKRGMNFKKIQAYSSFRILPRYIDLFKEVLALISTHEKTKK